LKEVHDPVRLTKVAFTNLDKVLYPELKITKAQVIEHYIRMAPKMLDQLEKRPITLTRFPSGLNGEGFYEKDAPMGTPSWVDTFKRYSETAKREIDYIVCNGLDTLVWLGNMAALTRENKTKEGTRPSDSFKSTCSALNTDDRRRQRREHGQDCD
jgi:bifunctional non-homologous end joining protein LigD